MRLLCSLSTRNCRDSQEARARDKWFELSTRQQESDNQDTLRNGVPDPHSPMYGLEGPHHRPKIFKPKNESVGDWKQCRLIKIVAMNRQLGHNLGQQDTAGGS